MRFHPVAFTGDLKQAFLQVRIKQAERDALRAFIGNPANDQAAVETLRFTRALFGLTCSPFVLGGVIKHHLESWKTRLPDVKELRKRRRSYRRILSAILSGPVINNGRGAVGEKRGRLQLFLPELGAAM
jgi:hypothetical protein